MMRVTHNMMIQNSVRSMSDNLSKLNDLQTKASSEKGFTKASEDPKAAYSAFNLRTSLQSTEAYLETAQTTQYWMDANELALSEMVDIASQAINVALEGISDATIEKKMTLADQIDDLLEEGIDVGNSKYLGSYLFSGFQTSTEPFVPDASPPTAITYAGDTGVIERTLAQDKKLQINIDGDATFSPLYTAMMAARDALRLDDIPAIQQATDDITAALDEIKLQRSYNGNHQQQVESIVTNLEQAQSTISTWISDKENANLVEVVSDLRYQETVYEAALEVGNRTMATINLFDILS